MAVVERVIQVASMNRIGGGRSGLAARSSSADIRRRDDRPLVDETGADRGAAAICSRRIGVALSSNPNGARASHTALATRRRRHRAAFADALDPERVQRRGEC